MKKDELDKWQNEIGISAMDNIESSEVNKILSIPSGKLHSTDKKELQHYLIVLSRYKMFLLRELGVLKSKIDVYSDKLEQEISLSASKYNAPAKEERRALAIQNDKVVQEYRERLEEVQIKHTQLKHLPDGIQEFINKIDRLEYRKANEHKEEGKIND